MSTLTISNIKEKSEELPALSSAASVLLGMIDDPDVTREDVTYLVSVDQTLAANAFKYANSAAIGARREFESVREIVDFLGLNVLKQIAIFVAAKSVFADPEIWFKSVFIANAAKKIANILEKESRFTELVYMAGLFQNYGLILLENNYADDLKYIELERNFQKRLEKEKQLFGFNHLEISAIALASMGIPKTIIKIIESQSDYSSSDFGHMNAVITQAVAVFDLRNASEEEINEALEAEPLKTIRSKFAHEKFEFNYDFVQELVKEAEELTNINLG